MGVQRVLHWPGQEAKDQHSKIPTVVWYDGDKVVHIMLDYNSRYLIYHAHRQCHLEQKLCLIRLKKTLKITTGNSPGTSSSTCIPAI
jgi:hypothetical protein